MTHLGNLGTPVDVEVVDDLTFDYFGETIRANASLGELDYVDFLDMAGGIDVNNPLAIRVVKDFARACIAPEDFETFWATAKKNRQDTRALFTVLTTIVEATADRPTERSSSSSDTPTTDATSSAPVLRRLEGRPDLQLLVQQAQEAQAAKAG